MRELKYAYRIPPCSKYDIAGMESWLEDMAAKGLFLDKDGLFLGLATFVHAEPEQLRFRLEATDTTGGLFSSTNDPSDDAIQLHRQMGWHYRGRWGQFHIYAADDPDAPELHTDPRIQALTIQALNKFQRSNLWRMILNALMLHLFYGSVIFSLTVLWGLDRTLLALAVFLSFPGMELVNLVKMVRLKRQLRAGIPMVHRSDYRRRTKLNYASRLARWIAGIFLVCSLLSLWGGDITGESTVAPEDRTEPLPFATVEDFFPEAQLSNSLSLIEDELSHWDNWISPENYDFTEYRWVTLPDGQETSVYIRIYYYRTRFDWFGLALAREQAELSAGSLMDRLFGEGSAPVPLKGLDADWAVSYTNYNPGIVLCRGGTVINLRYSRELSQFFTPEDLAQFLLDAMA